jgi:hypothetical protein
MANISDSLKVSHNAKFQSISLPDSSFDCQYRSLIKHQIVDLLNGGLINGLPEQDALEVTRLLREVNNTLFPIEIKTIDTTIVDSIRGVEYVQTPESMVTPQPEDPVLEVMNGSNTVASISSVPISFDLPDIIQKGK